MIYLFLVVLGWGVLYADSFVCTMSNDEQNSLTVFRIGQNGNLEEVENSPFKTGGKGKVEGSQKLSDSS